MKVNKRTQLSNISKETPYTRLEVVSHHEHKEV